MDDALSRAEHEEFAKRMEAEHIRQNHRIEDLEKAYAQNNKLLISVEKLALSMENMQREVREQNNRLDAIEARDGENWRKVTGYVATTVIGVVIGYIFTLIGM